MPAAQKKTDPYANDTEPAMLSKNEVVLPDGVAQNPLAAAMYVKQENEKRAFAPSNPNESNILLDSYASGLLPGKVVFNGPQSVEVSAPGKNGQPEMQTFDKRMVDPAVLADLKSKYGETAGPEPKYYAGGGTAGDPNTPGLPPGFALDAPAAPAPAAEAPALPPGFTLDAAPQAKPGLLSRLGDAVSEEWSGRKYPEGREPISNFGSTGAMPLAAAGGGDPQIMNALAHYGPKAVDTALGAAGLLGKSAMGGGAVYYGLKAVKALKGLMER